MSEQVCYQEESWRGSPAAAAKSVQSCPTPSDPMDCSLPGSSVHGIFQARVLEWGAIAFSRGIPTTHLKSNPLELYVGIFSFLSFIINFPIFLEIVFQNLNPLNITLYVPVVFCSHGFLISSIHQSMGFGYFQDSASLDLSWPAISVMSDAANLWLFSVPHPTM